MEKDIYKILSIIMEDRRLSIPDVARLCNLSDSTVRGIITRHQKSVALEVAFKLSKGLRVSLEKLNGLDERDVKLNTYIENEKIDKSEEKLIKNYRSLSEEGQEKLIDYADDLIRSGKYKKCNSSDMVEKQA